MSIESSSLENSACRPRGGSPWLIGGLIVVGLYLGGYVWVRVTHDWGDRMSTFVVGDNLDDVLYHAYYPACWCDWRLTGHEWGQVLPAESAR